MDTTFKANRVQEKDNNSCVKNDNHILKEDIITLTTDKGIIKATIQ